MQKLQPKLRFPEFKEEWEKDIIGNVCDISSGGTPSRSNNTFWDGEIPWVSTSLIDFNIISSTDEYITELGLKNSSAKLFPKGTILMAMYGQGKTRGKVSVLGIEASTNQACGAIIPKSEDLNYIYLFQNLSKRYDEIRDLSNQGGQENLSGGIIKSLEITFPSLPEQTKIASFLTTVDEKINLLKKQLSLLEQYKKGVMQKIFSREIRFKDEDGKEFPEWEEKILSEIISNFIVPMRDKPKELDGGIPWCRIEDFVGKYLEKSKSNQGVSVDTVKMMNLKIFPINTLLVSCSANLGFCAIVKTPLITNQTFIGLVPNMALIDVEFLYYTMRLSARKLNTLSSGTTISYLSREQFEKFSISVPSILEQKKIAAFLSSIDDKIEKNKEQIRKTELWKKGLLQQMFI
jgi:type I restriction enzyme S subunit